MAVVTPTEARLYASSAGFLGTALDLVVAIAGAESGYDTLARNVNTTGSIDRGILQINDYWWPQYSDAQCDDPATAFAAGYVISKHGADFTPWTTYLNGAYLRFLPVDAPTVEGLRMATLANFPFKDQRYEPIGPLDTDGVNENANFNCVATSFAAAIQYLTGKQVSGDELKDAEYGESYKNAGTALSRYVDQATDRARARYGVSAQAYNSSDTIALIHQARAWLRQGYPVICTIPSAWNSTSSTNMDTLAHPNFSTHAVVLYTENGTALGAMNPWGGVLLANPDEWWRTRLCYAQIWRIYNESGAPAPDQEDDPNSMAKLMVEQTLGFFHQNSTDDTIWRCNTTGWQVMGSILAFYRQLGGPGMGAQGLSLLGLPLTGELVVDAAYNGRYQIFEKGVICFDPDFRWDKPAGFGSGGVGCYFPHITDGFAFEQLTSTLRQEQEALHAQVSTLSAQLTSAQDALTLAEQQEQEALAAALQANQVAAEERQMRLGLQDQVAKLQDALSNALTAKAAAEAAAAAALAAEEAAEAKLASLEAAKRVLDDIADALKGRFVEKAVEG